MSAKFLLFLQTDWFNEVFHWKDTTSEHLNIINVSILLQLLMFNWIFAQSALASGSV